MSILEASWIDDELKILHESAYGFSKKEFDPKREQWERNRLCDRSAWNQAGEAGLLCASIPEEYGGAGGSYLHEAVIMDAMMRGGAGASIGMGNTVHSQVVAHYILNCGREEQKQSWLPRMASGELVSAVAMTEPGTGSDLQGVKTTARKEGDDYIINGSKTFISNGHHAELIIVVCKTDASQGSKGVSLIVIDTNLIEEGFERGRNLEKIGLKDSDTSELFFSDMRVPQANLLGDTEGLGFYQLMNNLQQERLSIACTAATIGEMALEETVAYVKKRKAFGKSVMDFQNTRFKLAECKTEATIMRSFVNECIAEHVENKLTAEKVSMAKWWTSQKQCEIVDECLQLHGGYGYMWEYPIARFYVDSRAQKIYGGTNEIMKELISRSL